MKASRYSEAMSAHRLGVCSPTNVVSSLFGRATGCGAGPTNAHSPPWPVLASAFIPDTKVDRISPEDPQRLYSGLSAIPRHLAREFIPLFPLLGRPPAGQFSACGDVFVSAGQSQSISLYNTRTWAVQKLIQARDVQWTITSTDVSPDSRFMTYSTMTPVCCPWCVSRWDWMLV